MMRKRRWLVVAGVLILVGAGGVAYWLDLFPVRKIEDGVAPKTASDFIKRGIGEIQGKQYSDAVADFSQALSLLPSYDTDSQCFCYCSLGAAYFDLGEYELAVENLSREIELEPNRDSYVLRAFAYEKLGRCQLALEDWKERLRLVPDDGLALRQSAISLCDLGNYVEALPYAQRMKKVNPSDANAYYTCGYVMFLWGHYDSAIQEFSRALDLKPDYADADTAREECYRREKAERKGISPISESVNDKLLDFTPHRLTD
jgi:tetratricopeptide (TPR) repeat protein